MYNIYIKYILVYISKNAFTWYVKHRINYNIRTVISGLPMVSKLFLYLGGKK